MCLAVPGEVIEFTAADELTRMARVRFGGAVREISLAFVPEADVGDHVLVHAGMAISRLSEERAADVKALEHEPAGKDEPDGH